MQKQQDQFKREYLDAKQYEKSWKMHKEKTHKENQGVLVMNYEELKRVNSEMKPIPIKDKDYIDVPQRVQGFRKLFPNGCISTNIESIENGVVIIKALVTDEENNLLATGYAYEKENNGFINKFSYIENCETSAVGRALGFLGLGSEGSICSAEELQNAKKHQEDSDAKEKVKNYNKNPVTPKMIKTIQESLKKTGKSVEGFLEWAEVDDITKVTQEKYQVFMNLLEGKK